MGKQENISKIIDLLSTASLTESEIIEKMGFTKSSWNKYRRDVKKLIKLQGKTIQIKEKKYNIVPLEGYEVTRGEEDIDLEEDLHIHQSSSRTVKEVLTLNTISKLASINKPGSLEGVATELTISRALYMMSTYDLDFNAALSLKPILDNDSKNAQGLLQRGYVIKYENERKSYTYDMTPKAPVYLKLGSDSFFNLKDSIEDGGQGYAFSDVLEGIDDRMSLLLDIERYDIRDSYRKIGVRGNQKPKIRRFLNKLCSLNYKDKMLKISYKGMSGEHKGEVKKMTYEVGLVIYASDKDRLYFIGRKNKEEDIIILNAERIVEMEESSSINRRYGSEEYLNIYEEMFSISTKEPFSITVEFDNIFNIKSKLKRLGSVRPNAKIYVKDGDESKLIYKEDRVRGEEDVARWLRSFGKSARVLEPKSLKALMKNSVLLTLKEYGEDV